MDNYGEIHRFFLRTIMSKCVLTNAAAENLINNHSENDGHSLKDIITDINKNIRPLQQQIKSITNDSTGGKEIVFISLGYDEAARSQTLFPPAELEYFKFLLEDIMLSEKKIISGITALNVASKVQLQSLSKTRAQELLDAWCILRYIKKTSTGYCLDTRGIHEFDTYFQHNFPDYVDVCFLCKQSAFQLRSCTPCGENFHIHCLEKYLGKIPKCPNCKIPHSDMNESEERTVNSQLGDDSISDTEQTQSQSQMSQDTSPEISQKAKKRKNH